MSSMDNVSAKLKYVYDQAVVRKDLILHGHIGRLPRFIAEYLIAKACGDHGRFQKLAELKYTCPDIMALQQTTFQKSCIKCGENTSL